MTNFDLCLLNMIVQNIFWITLMEMEVRFRFSLEHQFRLNFVKFLCV